jgi:hypothetical protein
MTLRRIPVLILALVLALLGLHAATPPTADAAVPPVLRVCNSIDSVAGSWIVAYNGGSTTPWIYRNQCRDIYNGNGGARVLSNWPYKLKPAGGSYGGLHCPNVDSNPPNVSKVFYRTKATC